MTLTSLLAIALTLATLSFFIVVRSILRRASLLSALLIVTCVPVLAAMVPFAVLSDDLVETLARLAPVWMALRLVVRGVVAAERRSARRV